MLLQVAAGNRLREDTAALNMTYTASVTAVEIDTPSANHGSRCVTFAPPVFQVSLRQKAGLLVGEAGIEPTTLSLEG